MSKILFSIQPTNDLGLLAQSLPAARELRNRSHEVIFSAGVNSPNTVLQDEGFKNYYVDYLMHHILLGDLRFTNFVKLFFSKHIINNFRVLTWYSKFIENAQTTEVWNFDHFMFLMGMDNENYTNEVIKSFQRLLKKQKPDVVVNLWNPYMTIAAKIEKIPLVSIIQSDIHPESAGFIWWKKKPTTIPSPVKTVNEILRKNKLPVLSSVADLCIGDLTLIVGTPETSSLPLEKEANYVGTLLLQNEESALPKNIRDLDHHIPIIWVYPGNLKYAKNRESSFDSIIVLEACIKVLGKMDVTVVLSTGYHKIPKKFFPLPQNFITVPYVPGISMAQKSDLIIHHGGLGTTQTVLYAGTPSIVIPTYSERESNARRICKAGTGEIVLPQSYDNSAKKYIDEEELYKKIRCVLDEKRYKENAVKISERLKKIHGNVKVADSIEKLLTLHKNN